MLIPRVSAPEPKQKPKCISAEEYNSVVDDYNSCREQVRKTNDALKNVENNINKTIENNERENRHEFIKGGIAGIGFLAVFILMVKVVIPIILVL